MEATLPFNWKNLTIEKYDGITDLDEHLDVYITQVSMYTMNDAILCRVFLTLLKGQALHWSRGCPSTLWIHLTPWRLVLAHNSPLVSLTA